MSEGSLHERIESAAAWFAGRPGVGVRGGAQGAEDIRAWIRAELGSVDALERPILVEGSWRQVVPPQAIYHILASNLAVSAEAAALVGWILGSRMIFKLPGTGLPSFEALVASCPVSGRMELLEKHDPLRMRACDAVVVLGSDATVEAVRAELVGTPRFVAYGSKISVGVVPTGLGTRDTAAAAAREVAAFQQRGCLSPQAYLCADEAQADGFATWLAEALRPYQDTLVPPPAVAGEIREARLRAHARGDRLIALTDAPGPTVVVRRKAQIEPGPGYGWVDVMAAPRLEAVLAPWLGKISTFSVAGNPVPAAVWRVANDLRVGRICRVGESQNPPLLWLHDGRPRLADLVTWVAADAGLQLDA
jgi:hypothetical protein